MILVPRPLASYKYNEPVSYSIPPILLQREWCHLPLLQRLQQMLPHLVLIEQAVSRLFSICKCCGKGNCEQAVVSSRETVGSTGGPGMAAIFGLGGLIILPWIVRGDHFRGGTVHGGTGQPQLSLTLVKQSCLEHLESGLAMEHLKLAKQMMN